jgi:hypothetical protein
MCTMHYFDRCLIFVSTSDLMNDSYPHEYGYIGVNLYPSANISNPKSYFFSIV